MQKNPDFTKFLFVGSLFFFTAFIWWFSDAVFFWDTVSQASKRGNYYYETNFQSLILDPALDSGHPPFFNIFIGLGWTFFGRNLAVSHFLMLPFVLGIVFQIYRLVNNVFPKNHRWLVFLIALADTTFLAQSILISPDIVMLFGFLLCLNAIFENKNGQLILGTFLMPFVSIRGVLLFMVIGVIFFIWKMVKNHKSGINLSQNILESIQKSLFIFLPVSVCLLAYLSYHYHVAGWLISSPNPEWIVHRQPNDAYNIARNIGLIGWRFLDNGRIVVSLLLLFFLVKMVRNAPVLQKNGQFLFICFGSFFLIFAPIFIFFSVAINNRYLLPAFLLLHLLVAYLIVQADFQNGVKKGWLFAILIALFSGTFWIYPKHIAQGWDGTLAHLPYYELRDKMHDFIQKEGIPLAEIGTEFPNKGALDFYDLSNKKEGLADKDFQNNQYIFYATVMNDFTDEELRALEEDWEVVKVFERWPIEVVLYRNPDVSEK